MARPTEFPTWAARMSTRAHCGCLAQAYAVLRPMFPELKVNETKPTRSHLRFQSRQPGDRRPPTAWLQLDDRVTFNVEETFSGRHLFCPNRNQPTSWTNRRARPRTAGGCPRKPRSSRPTRTSATATTTPSSSAVRAPHHLPATPGPTVSATGGDAAPRTEHKRSRTASSAPSQPSQSSSMQAPTPWPSSYRPTTCTVRPPRSDIAASCALLVSRPPSPAWSSELLLRDQYSAAWA